MHRDDESEEEWTDEEGDEDVVHTDDEDSKQEMEEGAVGDGGDDEDEDDEDWQSDGYQSDTLKHLATPLDEEAIDEFAIFKQTVMGVQQHDPEWWSLLTYDVSETNKVCTEVEYCVLARGMSSYWASFCRICWGKC